MQEKYVITTIPYPANAAVYLSAYWLMRQLVWQLFPVEVVCKVWWQFWLRGVYIVTDGKTAVKLFDLKQNTVIQ